MLDDQYLGQPLADAVRWVRLAQDAALAVDAKQAVVVACTTEAEEARQEWMTGAWLAAQDVHGLGTGNFTRVSQATLTRTIEVCWDFNKRGCLVYGSHRGRARAAFYTKVADYLVTNAHASYGQDDVRFLEFTLERATDIMSKVATICAEEGMEDGGILAMITDAHETLNNTAKVVGLLHAQPSLLEHRATVKEATATAAKARAIEREVV